MTNPYGTDPGSQSQGLGQPGANGPQFLAPGAPGTYGPPQFGPPQGPPAQSYGPPAPPTYGQQGPYREPVGYPPSTPFGQGYQQPPYAAGPPLYGQGYLPPSQPQPPRKRSSSTAVIIVVLVALVIGIAYGAYQLYSGTTAKPVTQATPTHAARTTTAPSATVRPPASSKASSVVDCVGGDKITTTQFVATVPANWSCDGDEGDISITSTRDDSIWVEHDAGTGDLAGDCRSQIEDLGTLTALAAETWGGKSAVSYQAVDSGDIYGVRCTVVGGQTWYLLYFPLDPQDDAAVRADVTKVMTTWVWK